VVYFAAWLAPEPLFSKAFAATLTVATLGLARLIPHVPEGGIWRLLPSVTPEGPILLEQSVSTAQAVADGSLIVSGVAAGAAICSSLALCATNASGSNSSGAPTLSTRYGQPHTRQNPSHNETIERDLASREWAMTR